MRQTPLTASVLEIADGPRPIRDSAARSAAGRDATHRSGEKPVVTDARRRHR